MSRGILARYAMSLRRLAMTTVAGLLLALQFGCPTGATNPTEFLAGSTGDATRIGTTADVDVLSPVSDLSITGGTPVEVNWRAVATTRLAVIDIFVDVDQDPDNGNEIIAANNQSLDMNSTVIDTTQLAAGDYFVGVRLEEFGAVSAAGYATGRVTINQRTDLFFTSPRGNFVFDRSLRVNPRFDVAWSLDDPDSIVSIEVFLDPDETPNGNEVLLRESNSQTGDSFVFDFPTSSFEPGTYRILALVSDGVDQFPFYAPGSIRLRSRLSGVFDLRDLELPGHPLSGAKFEGFNPRDNAGSFVGTLRDFDNDGFEDFVILSQFGKPRNISNVQRSGAGEAYIAYGRARRFNGAINLNSTGTLFRGEIITGVPAVDDPIRPSRGITSVAALADWDGDGFREIAWGVPFTDSTAVNRLDSFGYFRSGCVVISASIDFRPDIGNPGRAVLNLANFGAIQDAPPSETPCVEGFAGPKAPISPGAFTYFFRHNSVGGQGAPGSALTARGTLGCRISSNEFGDGFGETVSAFEFRGILMSAPGRDPALCTRSNIGNTLPGAGVVTVYYSDDDSATYLWAPDFAPPGNDTYPGLSVNLAVNAIPHAGPNYYIAHDNRVFPGQVTTLLSDNTDNCGYDASNDATPCVYFDTPGPNLRNSARIYGGFNGARISGAVSVPDFNTDGLQDILVGSPLSNDGAGSCFVVFGRLPDLMLDGELAVEELGLPVNSPNVGGARIFDGVRIVGEPGERLGQSQDSVGDFNGDGIFDIGIGSPLLNNRQGGAAVFFGSREVINLTEDEIPFGEIADRGLGIVFVGETEGDLAGARIRSAGDVDQDGLDDILIAAPNRSVRLDIDLDGEIEIDRQECGVVYLIYGSSDLRGTIELSQVGTEQLPGAVFVGAASSNFLGAGLGLQGDRSNGISTAGDVDGDGNDDLLISSVSAAPRGGRVEAGEVYLIYGTGD